MTVVDARMPFECARSGHVPKVTVRTNPFVASFICECARCHRLVEFNTALPDGETLHIDGCTLPGRHGGPCDV